MRIAFKSVKSKIMLLIMPALLVIVTAIVILANTYAKSIIEDQTDYSMHEQLNGIKTGIENRLVSHQKLPETLAHTAGGLTNQFSMKQYEKITTTNLETNSDTFGLGFFSSPMFTMQAASTIAPTPTGITEQSPRRTNTTTRVTIIPISRGTSW